MTLTYAVRAHNTATQSENRIHADDVAQQYGFKGGLVPGVTVYAYMVRPVAERWGLGWVEHGSLNARFVKPVYEGDATTVEFDDDSGALTVRNGRGETCATGTAGRHARAVPDVGGYSEAPLPATRHPASPESLAAGTPLGSLDAGFHADKAEEYLGPIADDLALWRTAAVAHPGYIVSFANYILSSNVKLGPWIHVETTAEHFSAVADGERWSIRGRTAACYERKGHKFVDLDLLVVADATRPVMAIRHTAIYEPVRRA
ncbi:MAG: MaoC family dehydratase [Actinobacteria bacterium]|nr:MaoC family dehydratase [Actinomycetota bacterium]